MTESTPTSTPEDKKESTPAITDVIDMTDVPEDAQPFMQAAVFVTAAAQVLDAPNRALAMVLRGQANALFDIVEAMSGNCKTCGGNSCCGIETSAEVNAEIEDLVKDIESMISNDQKAQ
jgi:hypothetical protein